jgi:Copper transport outer membrane protein, MctB
MFTFRYHLVSLAAVFVALAVGILLGAAISGKLGDAEDALTKQRFDSLNDQLAQERIRSANAERASEATREVLEDAYPALMDSRLEGQGIAVLFLGPVDGDVRSAVERTLADAGAGSPVRLIALDTPIDPQALEDALTADEELAQFADNDGDFGELGEALGRELVAGEGTPLWSALSGQLIEERTGSTSLDVAGVVVARSWTGSTDGEESPDEPEVQATETLFDGLLGGVLGSDVPAVGVETLDADESSIPDYARAGASSVDDVDATVGRLALALLLAGGDPGHYGVKETATDGVVPPVEPVVTTTSE